uniref:Uncharacterized protein n=1 Tax=Rhizobium rhizogenes TaxID=359 RepID=A0A7S5DQK3_RHIRH|nr:hypothetical protein pC5.7b_366 [Rhizobium rhizogenes]QCL09866.1 hypothetical protein pC5.8b_376 [Rhizobium rhizogenes]
MILPTSRSRRQDTNLRMNYAVAGSLAEDRPIALVCDPRLC